MSNSFSTSNFHLAASLSAAGHQIARVDRGDPRNVKIFFDDQQNLRDDVEAYWNGTLQVTALRHNQEYQTLMARIND